MAKDPRVAIDMSDSDGMYMTTRIAKALSDLGIPDTDDMVEQFSFFVEAMKLYEIRSRKYGDAWKQYGATDCLFHMRSKLARTRAVIENEDDSLLLDDAIDLLNYTVFAVRNALEGRV